MTGAVTRHLRVSPRRLIFGILAFTFLFTLYHISPLSNGDFGRPVSIWPVHVHPPPRPHRPYPPPRPENPGWNSEAINWPGRAEEVKRAFLHAYHGYEEYAAPKDELHPISNDGVDNFNGWGVTMFDSLSTMLLMELHDEFTRALPLIQRQNFSMKQQHAPPGRKPPPAYAPFFETVIRYLGGLLSAYALSHEPILLERADELATKLAGAFDTPFGLPAFGVNTETGNYSAKHYTILAEIASCQLEYSYLAKVTGKKEHYDRSAKIMETLEKGNILRRYGMFPTKWNIMSGEPTSEGLSVGGAADSAHEYLLKLYLLTGKSDTESLKLYIQTANTILSTLLYVSSPRGLLYVTDVFPIPKPSHKFEHLSCFLPGLLALGAHTLPDSAFDIEIPAPIIHWKDADELGLYNWKELHMLAAQGLAESCYQMYEDQPTGLGPDEVLFRNGELWVKKLREWRERGRKGPPPGVFAKKTHEVASVVPDYDIRSQKYLLRPETIESIFLMWKTTGDPVWRERGWRIFKALESETKTPSGYASLYTVSKPHSILQNEMPSYFLAESLKYLYLLFRDDDLVPLDRWVFNTEAHPLPVFEWSAWERKKFGIS
ncbi:seven-hairpin glycosidase [Irpex rosettiformis]|uniref:Seven-hairpin glycosidase n=1 Tax=Irpex rosettiformis TaxID=378272 RepID=A0ACB8TP03_9APHY|nr:seven-hairpin glycosidase [Irpex rosettiformis]